MRRIIVLCVMLCLCVVSNAQMFTNIRATQTLTVRAITQTDDGRVWFCAGKTLYCFDGKKIRPLDSDAFDGMGAIGCMKVNRDGNIMMGCERGMVIYDIRKGLFDIHENYRGENVRTICLEGGDEWIGTSGGFYHNGCVVDSLSDVVSLIKEEEKILVSCMDAIKEYDIRTGKIERMEMPIGGFITCFEKDARGKVIAGSVNSISDYDFAKNKLTPLHNDFPVVKCMMKDARGLLMVGCDGGLYEIDDEVKKIVHDARNNRSLAGDVVWCMMQDKQGNTWIGTDNGLSVMTSSQDFCIYPLSSITESGMGNQVYCMLRDSENRLWMGGSNGIVKVDDFGKSTQTYAWYEMNSEVHHIPHNRIRLFYEDPLWGVWACTDGGLLHFDEYTQEWNLHVIAEDEHNWIYNVHREADALVVTSFNAVYRVKYDAAIKQMNVIQRIEAKPCLDNQYSEISIGDTKWAISANGLLVSNEKMKKEKELPEKFVSIYYNADKDLVYLGGADIFAVIQPQSFLQQEKTSIWFDADARFVGDDDESWLTKGLIIGMVCACLALVLMLVLYILQQRRMKMERARRKAMLKSAREKMTRLESDKNSLQQQLHLQQLSVQSQAGKAESEGSDEKLNSDDLFVVQVNRLIEENIDNPELSVTMLSEKLGISSKQLYRKVKQCTDLTAVEYIRKLRLQKAALLLKNPEFTINEVMYMVGFSNPSYFSRSFASEYGMPPSEWRS